jgi:S-DNA-T family DNA segregation ATPase FtsK/SpoIIIE
MELSPGTATLRWAPTVRAGAGTEVAPEVSAILEQAGSLPSVPVPAVLSDGGVIGLQGDRAAALAVARSLLCQAAVTSGPADVAVAVFTDHDRACSWDWAKWLPHTHDRRGGGSSRLLAAGPEEVDTLARTLLDAGSPADQQHQGTGTRADARAGPLLFVVVDGAALLEGRPCPLRELLAGRAGPAAGIVLTGRLPALCSLTMDVAADGTAELRRLTLAETVGDMLATGITEPLARRCARALARFEDPELRIQGAGLPDMVTLLPLLGMPETSAGAVADRWRTGADSLRATAVLGVSERDVLRIDLDDDGPHGLIAGTTGSGKSELLRTLVASLAVDNDPEHLTFVLIDYKGGGALDECARFPHSAGLITDLDEQLGARALRCLEAELRHRERLLRRAGLSHIRDYQRLRGRERPDLEPMPRLAVVIDEFATLVKALPDFVDSLVGIARRGRSLGMHLVMATQRPAGSVSDAIKNNVKLRIALRLESASDSGDVIDSPAAAGIGGRQWGRAFYRVSAREVLPVQTALSTAVTAGPSARCPVLVRPFRFQSGPAAPAGPPDEGQQPTDLQRLLTAAQDAFTSLGMAAPRQPWPEPLPDRVLASGLPETAVRGLQTGTEGLPVLALADDPDRQAQYPVGWDPGAGNLLLYGVLGSGTSTALATVALGLAARYPPDRLHLYVLDLGAGDLAPLTRLPHTGAHVGAAEPERRRRLVRLLRRELDARKGSGAEGQPIWTVLVDNLGAFLAEHGKDAAGMRLTDDLQRVYADGPTVGIHMVAAADRPASIPGAWASLTQQKLLFRLADRQDYGYFSVPRASVPSFVPGRAVVAATAQVIQVAWPGHDLAAAAGKAAARWAGAAATAPRVEPLPARAALRSLGARARTSGEPWWVPVGLGDTALEPVGLTLYEREHALIAGPPRSGRSLALCTVAEALRKADNPPVLVGYAPRRSPLRDISYVRAVADYNGLTEAVDAAAGSTVGNASGRGVAILIDDADTVEDKAGVIAKLLASAHPGLHVIAAGRADAMRRGYNHWTQKIRDSRCGILLVPDHDLDGPLLGVGFPRFGRMAPAPGRGYLAVGGVSEGVQVALPGAPGPRQP